MAETTIKIDQEVLRQLKLRKVVLDFDNYNNLIRYMLAYTPDEYTTSEKRPHPRKLGWVMASDYPEEKVLS